MSKKKVSKSVFYDPAGVVLEKIKHSGDESDISLSKSRSGDNMYSDANSLFGDDKSVSMAGISNNSLLDLAANILKAKQVNTNAVFGFLLSSLNFIIDDNKEVSFPLHFLISLDRK
ncbi:hypothetical protein G9A89_013948 [Geosiphon pyriformis]|nr:hypothetical protein G9A89_013948 [Geosiphon pyriformis]